MDYQSGKWKKKRAHILRLDGYRDRVAAMYGRSGDADTVHHIRQRNTRSMNGWTGT